MLVLIGKQMNDSTIVGYRVIDLSITGSNQSIQCSGVRTVDTYQILQLMYTKDPQTNTYYRFLNADLYYTMQDGMDYKLTVADGSLIWEYVKDDGTLVDRKIIANYGSIDFNQLKVKPIGNEIWSYGLYPEQGTPYVVLAMKCDSRNRPVSYYVVDAAFETGGFIEEMKSDMFLSKVEYRANHYRHDGVANGKIENGVFKPYGQIVTLRDSTLNGVGSNTVSAASLTSNNTNAALRYNNSNTTNSNSVIVVPESITKLTDGLLVNNMELETLVLHSGVHGVEPHSLLGCPNFKQFDVDKGNIYMCSPGGLLISKNGAELLRCPPRIGMNITCIPKYTKRIASGAFRGVTNLTEIFIPPTVEEVDAGAFVDCPNLRKVVVCAKTIHEDAFVSCPNLAELIVGKGVETITGTLVRNCPLIQFLILPDTLKSIRGMTYAEWLPNGIAAEKRIHKLIEFTPVRAIFAPPAIVPYISELFTDSSMYDTSNGKKFMFLQNTEQNLLCYKLGMYLKFVR